MKRVLTLGLAVLMMVMMSVTIFAAPDGFVSSPSGNPAPELIDFDPSDDECTAWAVITSYANRYELSDFLRGLIERAYEEITNSRNLTELNAALAKLVSDKKLNGSDLAVSDLFDIHVTGCDYHEGHVDFDVVLKADTLKGFVGLLHMNKNGEWELVEDATITKDGHLKFSVEDFSPFAIVVNTGENAPETGDNSMIYVYTAAMAISALSALAVVVKIRKQKI